MKKSDSFSSIEDVNLKTTSLFLDRDRLSNLITPSIMIDRSNNVVSYISNYDECCKEYIELSLQGLVTIVKFPREELTIDLIVRLVKDKELVSILLECLIPDTSILDFDAFIVDWGKFLNEVEDK